MSELKIELSEKNILDLATVIAKERGGPIWYKRLDEMFEQQPEEFQSLLVNCLSYGRDEENVQKALDFISPDGEFSIDRAVTIYLIGSMGVSKDKWRYHGKRWDWRTREYIDHGGRVREFDFIFNAAKEAGVFTQFLEEVIARGSTHTLNTNCRVDVAKWIADNRDMEITEKLIKVFLRGYFKGDEKTIVMQALIDRGELGKLEIFWKSRAHAVQKLLVSVAPLEKLPFMLGTKNKKLLELIEKRMMESIPD